MAETDFTFQNHGTIFLCTANNDEALKHLKENVNKEAQWWGKDSVVVEPRYVADLATALQSHGFTVEG